MGALPLHRSEAESRRRWKFGLFAACLVWGGWRRHRRALPDATAGRVAAHGDSSKLDLVFTLDVTGSMGAYIDGAKENIEAITERLVSRDAQRFDRRFGLVAYRDHPPEDTTFVTRSFGAPPAPRDDLRDMWPRNRRTIVARRRLHARGRRDAPAPRGSRGVGRRRHARGRGHGPRQRPAAVIILRYFDRKSDE